jgi:hypothetical protein
MANINVTPAGPVRFTPQTGGADVASMGGGGQGLVQAGKDIMDVGAFLKQSEDRRVDLDRQKMVAEDTLHWATRRQELALTLPDGGVGMTSILKAEMEQRGQERRGTLGTKGAQDTYDLDMLNMKASVLGRAIGVEAVANAVRERRVTKETLDLSINQVATDPSLAPQAVAASSATIDKMRLNDDAAKNVMRTAQTEAIWDTAVGSMLDPKRTRTADAARKVADELTQKVWQERLNPKDYQKRLTDVNRLVKTYEDKETALFTKAFAESSEEVANGNMDAVISEQEIFDTVQDPEDREALLEVRTESIETGTMVNAIAVMPEEDVKKLEAQLIYNRDKKTGDFHEDKRKLTAFNKAKSIRTEAINADRVAYIHRNYPSVAEAYAAMTAAQKAMLAGGEEGEMAYLFARKNYVAEAKSAQRALGVVDPYLLPNLAVTQVKSMMDAVQQTPEGADELAQELGSLARVWGDEWPTVFKQLAAQGAVTGDHVWLARIAGDISKNPALITLAKAIATPEADMLANKKDDPKFKTNVSVAVSAASKEFQDTLHWQGAAATSASFQRTAEKMAMYYVTQKGFTLADATDRAVAELAGADFKFFNSYRVPKDQQPDAVERGAKLVRGTLHTMTFADDPKASNNIALSLKANASWVTTPNEDGLLLVDEAGRLQKTVDGNIVQFTWEQFRDASARAPGGAKSVKPVQEEVGAIVMSPLFNTPMGSN